MLQLPASKPIPFTKAQVAEITRGSKAPTHIRSASAKPDPIIKLCGRVLEAHADAFAAAEALKLFYASHSSDEVKPAAIYLPGGTLVHVALSTTENEFFETYHIDKWGQKHQKFYGMIIAGRQPNPKHKRVSKEVAKEYLQHVDQLVLNMKKALRRKQAETKRRWKANGYQNLLDKQERANKRFMDARAAFLKEALVSVDGVYAAPAMVAEFSRLDCKDKALGFAMLPHLVATIIDKQVITLRRMQSKKQ